MSVCGKQDMICGKPCMSVCGKQDMICGKPCMSVCGSRDMICRKPCMSVCGSQDMRCGKPCMSRYDMWETLYVKIWYVGNPVCLCVEDEAWNAGLQGCGVWLNT